MSVDGRRARHRMVWAGGLFFFAPFVGEFLLGNQPITEFAAILLLAPMYGAGALLIREIARRTGRGWPTMILLGAAYAILEEGPIDQMLWNPHYGGFDMGAAYAETRIPALGTSVQMIQDVLSLHTIWSICVPIAVIEALSGEPRRPWLGRFGTAAVGTVFVGGSLFLALAQVQSEDFVATPFQFATAIAAIAVLSVAAFAVTRPAPVEERPAPSPWTAGATSFAATGLFGLREFLPGGVSAWYVAAGWFVLAAGSAALFLNWSHRRGWGDRHRLALAGGALLTYVWIGVDQGRYLEVSRSTALLGNLVFGLVAVLILIIAVRRRQGDRKWALVE